MVLLPPFGVTLNALYHEREVGKELHPYVNGVNTQ